MAHRNCCPCHIGYECFAHYTARTEAAKPPVVVPITPIEHDGLRELAAASAEAEAAVGTPAFSTLARRYHSLANTFTETFGWDPRPGVRTA